MMTKILAVLSLAALPFHSMAHNEYAIGSTEIELYEIELSPNEKIKLKHLKIHSENERNEGDSAVDDPLPPSQNNDNESDELSLTPV
jgi:hypothetical protein